MSCKCKFFAEKFLEKNITISKTCLNPLFSSETNEKMLTESFFYPFIERLRLNEDEVR